MRIIYYPIAYVEERLETVTQRSQTTNANVLLIEVNQSYCVITF